MRAEVAAGLSRPQKELPPKYFYDAVGSRLFERITRLPEYYLTRAELALLRRHAPELAARLQPATLVELGPGGPSKASILLDALTASGGGVAYVPVDVSTSYLEQLQATLARRHATVRVTPVQADFTVSLPLVRAELSGPVLFAFLGSTIGNFEPAEAVALLRRVAVTMRPGDRLVLGADLKKERAVLERAYNDAAGVTARFNLNVLTVLRRSLGAEVDPGDFAHRAFYDAGRGRIEMHLVARRALEIRIPALGRFPVAAGESIRTEISCKYDRAGLAQLLWAAGLAAVDWLEDRGVFALAVAGRA
jgi:L-histidine N-alpha-methyltransferase